MIFVVSSFFSVTTNEPNENRLLQSAWVILTVESDISRAQRVTSAAVGPAAASSIAISTDLIYRTTRGLFIFKQLLYRLVSSHEHDWQLSPELVCPK